MYLTLRLSHIPVLFLHLSCMNKYGMIIFKGICIQQIRYVYIDYTGARAYVYIYIYTIL